jgi:hypothetical protein
MHLEQLRRRPTEKQLAILRAFRAVDPQTLTVAQVRAVVPGVTRVHLYRLFSASMLGLIRTTPEHFGLTTFGLTVVEAYGQNTSGGV